MPSGADLLAAHYEFGLKLPDYQAEDSERSHLFLRYTASRPGSENCKLLPPTGRGCQLDQVQPLRITKIPSIFNFVITLFEAVITKAKNFHHYLLLRQKTL